MKKNKERYIDLSDIKENDLDNTASFTDLMSREEIKKRKKIEEEEKTQELKEILMNDEDKKRLRKKKKKKEKMIAKEEKRLEKTAIKEFNDKSKKNTLMDDEDIRDITKTQRFLDLTNEIKVSMLNNVDENIKPKEKKFSIGNIVISDIIIIISLAFYIYSILFTNYQNNELYLLIGGLIILAMIMFFCISTISGRILSKIFSVLIYLLFIGYILFNLILVLGIITI